MTSTKKKKESPPFEARLELFFKKRNAGQIIAVVAPSKHSERTALALLILNL